MASLDELRAIVARLRGPDGCPWDRVQTHLSIRPQLIEEAYEVLEAIEEANDGLLCEELGDVLLHIIFHALLAEERGAFHLEDVISGIRDKLIRRHPHVFGSGTKLDHPDQVLSQWDELKKSEKAHRQSALDGIPSSLPALMRAQETQKKAAKVGFDWKSAQGALQKIQEEAHELAQTHQDPARAHDELGDLLFSIVNLARHLGLDAEQALRDATAKFSSRFRQAEASARQSGRDLTTMSEAELEELWQAAKTATSTAPTSPTAD